MRIKETSLIKFLTAGIYVLSITLLTYLHNSLFPFITIKVYPFQAIVEILFAAWILLILLYPQYRPKITALSVSIAIFIALIILTAVLGVDVHRSFWSTQDRGLGVIALVHFFVLFAMLKSLGRAINWRKYFSFIFFLSVIASVFAIVPTFIPSLQVLFDATRPGSFFGNPTFLAAFLLFTVFIGLWLARTAVKRNHAIAYIALSLFEVLVIFDTGTRGAILGLAAGGIILLLMSKRRRIGWYGLGAVAVFAVIVFATRSAPFWQSIPGVNRITQISSTDTTVADRLKTWAIAWQSFTERPIFGWGFENFRNAFDQHYDPTLLRAGFTETFFDKPHNIFLEMLVVGGVPLFLSYLALLWLAGWVIVRKVPPEFRAFGLAALAAYIVQNLFVFDTFGSYFMFFIFLAYADSQGTAPQKDVPRPALPAGRQASGIGFGWATGELVTSACFVFVSLMMLYAVYVNAKILYANHLEYWGINYAANRLPDQAFTSFSKGLAIDQPYRDEFRINYLQIVAQMYQQGGFSDDKTRIAGAISEAQQAIADAPDNYTWNMTLADARTAFNVADPSFLKGADQEIAAAIALAPKRQQSYYVTAKLAALEQTPVAAEAQMQHAIDLDPLAGDPHFYYGLLLFELNDPKLGMTELERARQLGRTPQDFAEFSLVGGYYADAGNYATAESYFKSAMRYDPSDMDVHLKLGLVYYYENKYPEARTEFETILAALPDFKTTPNYQQFKSIFDAVGAT